MKLEWSPEMASQAYIAAVKALADHGIEEDANVAELVSAMAGGWRAQLIVEACAGGAGAGAGVATSLGLATAAKHTFGAHVCVVPDDCARDEYVGAMGDAGATPAEVVVGEAGEVVRELEGVDFMVVDLRRRDAARVVKWASPGPRGMVLVCRTAAAASAGGHGGGGVLRMMGEGVRVVRSAYLPIGSGVEILHVGVGEGPGLRGGSAGGGGGAGGRWIRHVDKNTGEEHVFRR